MTFGRPTLEQHRANREAQRAANMRTLAIPSRALNVGSYTGHTTSAVPKEEKARPGKRTPNKAEKAWMDAAIAFGCIACYLDGQPSRPTAIHHILRGTVRMGHLHSIGLCDPGHHQNGKQFGMVSRHPHKAAFEAKYGTEAELLARLRAEIGATP